MISRGRAHALLADRVLDAARPFDRFGGRRVHVPVGPNFRVNAGGGIDDGAQRLPSVGAGGGGWVVLWLGAGSLDVLAQRFDGSGARIGGVLTVASGSYVDEVAVAVAPSGGLLVVCPFIIPLGP